MIPSPHSVLIVLLATVCLATAAPAAEVLEVTGCRGTGLVEVRAGDAARGLPHWDPVERILRDRIVVQAQPPLGALTPLIIDVDAGTEARLLPIEEGGADEVVRPYRPRRRASVETRWDLRLQGPDAYSPSLVLAVGEECGPGADYLYQAGRDDLGLPGEETAALPQPAWSGWGSRQPVLFRYDQLWPMAFVGSGTGWYVAGTRYTVGFSMELLEVQFVASRSGAGAAYQVLIFHSPEVTMDNPALHRLVAVANGVVTATGEEPVATQRVSFVETGLQFEGGTLWIGIRNLEGISMALAVDASFDHQGNGFASTTNGEQFWDFGLNGPRDGRPMVRALVLPLGGDAPPGPPAPALQLPGGSGF